ncbi:hypothetical protein BDQ94DRAFT_131275 [Aspergillus welwitschiae]|uniref:Uncharacterized protein n=1 Tax=Aspergillus welwitschiae TaxID=1341132 RepID=A0A3F3PIF3_9EURO|nr:hypothetical protein BDQ94DRAFT_131275 [Aspergillus welwitschiae]RDH26720.1 hypothetical protein BDQ94DRAFT_131275 [Aspergillus welwitschiae]
MNEGTPLIVGGKWKLMNDPRCHFVPLGRMSGPSSQEVKGLCCSHGHWRARKTIVRIWKDIGKVHPDSISGGTASKHGS